MKVLCIDDKPKGPPEAQWLIKEGETYIVSEAFTDTRRGYYGEYYELTIQKDVGYLSEYFIPLSDIDETEMIREKESVCQS